MCTHFSTQNLKHFRRFSLAAGLVLLALGLMLPAAAQADICSGKETYTADVVLFDTFMMFNRLGAQNPNWMMYALARDMVDGADNPLTAEDLDSQDKRDGLRGNVSLRPDKRPRPLVLRIPADSCLEITFSNLLTPTANPNNPDPPLNNNNQVASRHASVHIAGLQVVNNLADDGTFVGENANSATENGLVPSGGQHIYTVYAAEEGAFLMTSHGATFGGEATGGNIGVGAFGMVAVQPRDAVIYRSQVTEEEFRLASVPINGGNPEGIDYEALYPAEDFLNPVNEIQTISNDATDGTFTLTFSGATTDEIAFNADASTVETALEALATINDVAVTSPTPQSWDITFLDPGAQDVSELTFTDIFPPDEATTVTTLTTGFEGTPNAFLAEGKDGLPVLNMICNDAAAAASACAANEIVHSEINAIVAYKNGSGNFANFPPSTYPLESKSKQNPSVPNRLEAFRDFASIWHDETAAVQAFPAFFSRATDPDTGEDTNPIAHALHGVRDSFMINYGSGGIGSEIIANRLGVGPMYDCLGCAYEEFFLTSFTVGDPAMIVDVPANAGLENCGPDLDAGECAAMGRKANEAFYPDDPANVHHSYTGDKAKLRNVHAAAQRARRAQGAAHLSPPQPPVAVQRQRRQLQLPGRPGRRPRLHLHLRDQLRRLRQPQQDLGRLHLPLPLLPALCPGHVVPLAPPRRAGDGHVSGGQRRIAGSTGVSHRTVGPEARHAGSAPRWQWHSRGSAREVPA
jgi:hypothetical protein